ncbi:motile sperm domain-containing protein 2-like isoform X3 [Drosophila mojavensis]|nr:motile sperm domain-containing protein 2-like isoform X3 [Drosophila mojavensis]
MAPHDSSNGKLHTPSDLVMLQLEPKEFVNICKDNGEAKVSLRNICNKPVVYKIQTTSPEKFRVRPRCGIIPQNESTEVHIWLKSDQILSSDGKDKFLVMATCTSDSECGSQAVADMWRAKSSTDPDVETFRLVCRMDEKSECAKTTNMKSDSSSSEFGADKFQEQAQKMEAQLNFTKHLQYATLALLLLLFIGFGFLMYEQMIKHSPAGGSCRKAPAYTCPKRK